MQTSSIKFVARAATPHARQNVIRALLLLFVSLFIGHTATLAGGFASIQRYTAGVKPVGVATGDFNHDGKLDLAIASTGNTFQQTSTGVFVLLGNGDGTYQTAVRYAIDSNAAIGSNGLKVADLNGDGNLDIVALKNGQKAVSVLLGNSDGTFVASVSYALNQRANDIVVGDFNGDGNTDVATLSYSSGVDVLFGDGKGALGTPITYPAGVNADALAVGDFNNDRKPDLVTLNSRTGVSGFSILLNKGDGTFNSPVDYMESSNSPMSSIAVGDFNSDGRPDIASANRSISQDITILFNSPAARGLGASLSTTEGTPLTNIQVATITDLTVSVTASNFTATINWGDNTATSSGTITQTGNGAFSVTGSHTYAEEGTFTLTVTITDTGDNRASATTTVIVADAPLTAIGRSIDIKQNASFSGTVASFTDADPNGTVTDYTATINWGDNTAPTAGVVTANSNGGFNVSGTHTYASAGTFTVTITISDAGGASATANSTANVTPPTYTISGQVTNGGAGLSGVTVTLSGGATMQATTDASGNYSFPNLLAGANYTVTASKTNFNFTPPSQSFANLSGNQTANFTAAPTIASIQFGSAAYSVSEAAGSVQITVTRTGDTTSAVTIDYATSGGTASPQRNYETATGTLSFAANETSKTFNVLVTDNVYVEGALTVNLTLSNPTGGAATGTQNTSVLTITDDDSSQATTNPIDDAQFFVRQQYHDFLNREPEPEGLAYWTNEITKCGTDQKCISARRRDVSAAFFISEEFQQTGYYVYRIIKASTGNQPNYLQYTNGINQVWAGTDMAVRQTAYAGQQVNPQYASLSNDAYVDQLYQNAGVAAANRTERAALISGLNAQTETRGTALQKVANNQTFQTQDYNPAFVLAEYFGYLRRDPDAAGYQFWLDVLNNRVPGNYRSMVCAFSTSREYQLRFSPVVTRNDRECAR